MNDLTHFWPMLPFYTPWKHQKTKGFSGVFKGYKMGKLARNGLSINKTLSPKVTLKKKLLPKSRKTIFKSIPLILSLHPGAFHAKHHVISYFSEMMLLKLNTNNWTDPCYISPISCCNCCFFISYAQLINISQKSNKIEQKFKNDKPRRLSYCFYNWRQIFENDLILLY